MYIGMANVSKSVMVGSEADLGLTRYLITNGKNPVDDKASRYFENTFDSAIAECVAMVEDPMSRKRKTWKVFAVATTHDCWQFTKWELLAEVNRS